jgi:hypothetical protein
MRTAWEQRLFGLAVTVHAVGRCNSDVASPSTDRTPFREIGATAASC